MPYKQDTKKITGWKQINVDRIVIEPRKDKHFPERLKKAVDAGKATSRQDYIIRVVESALDNDGIPAEDKAGEE